MNYNVFGGLLLIIAGVYMLMNGLKEEKDAMGGLKYRKLLIGGASIFFGLIIMLR